MDDGELGGSACSHDDDLLSRHRESVVLARDGEVDDYRRVDVLRVRDVVDEVLSFGEAEFSGGKFSFEDRLGAIDGCGVGISCHVEVLHESR